MTLSIFLWSATLHVSLTDAMGHTMDAALLATVLVRGLRNAPAGGGAGRAGAAGERCAGRAGGRGSSLPACSCGLT